MRKFLLLLATLVNNVAFAQLAKEYETIEKKITQSDFQGVVKDADAIIASLKSRIEEYTKMIDGYNRNRDPKKKVFDYKQELAMPFYYRGIGNAGLNKNEDALKDFNTAISFYPKHADAYEKRAAVFMKVGKSLEACKDYKISMDMGNKQAKGAYDENFCWEKGIAYYKDGKTALNLKKYDHALGLFNESLALYADTTVYFLRSKTFLGLQNNDSALIDINKAIELSPENTGYYYNRAMMHYNAGDFQAAFDDFSKVIKNNPAHVSSFLYRALASEALSQQKSAIFDYNQVIRLQPDNGQAYFRRGLLKETVLNDRPGACEDYLKAVELGVEEAESNAAPCKKVKKR